MPLSYSKVYFYPYKKGMIVERITYTGTSDFMVAGENEKVERYYEYYLAGDKKLASTKRMGPMTLVLFKERLRKTLDKT